MLSTIQARQEALRYWRQEEWSQLRKEYPNWAAMADVVGGDVQRLYALRNYAEQLQEMYLARKHDLVTDDHWRAMRNVMDGFFSPRLYRELFDWFAYNRWLTPEFVAFGREYASTRLWKDPLHRLPDEGPPPRGGSAPPTRNR